MNFYNKVYFFIILFLLISCGESDDTKEPIIESCSGEVLNATSSGSNNVLVWADEFNYEGEPCNKNWNYDLGAGGWGNGEAQIYTRLASNVKVENGVLKIIDKKENFQGSQYTSAR